MASSRLLRGRWSEPGAFYTLTTVALARARLFAARDAADAVSGSLRYCHESGLVDAVAWVVMPDHVHWIFALHQSRLSDVAREFKSRSAREVNRLLGRTGQVWQAGCYDHRLRGNDDLREQARYVVMNPVRAGKSSGASPALQD